VYPNLDPQWQKSVDMTKAFSGSAMYGARSFPKAASVAGLVLPTMMGTKGG